MSIEDKNLTPSSQQALKTAWNNEAGKFWKPPEDGPITLNDFFIKFFQEHRDKIKNVLDIGCGTGRYLIPMVQDGKQVTGLDISDEMIVGAQENLKKLKIKGRAWFVEGVSTNLGAFPDASFDFVLAKGSIHHNTYSGVQQSFKEVARVLKPRGFFLFQGRSTKDGGLDPSKAIPDKGMTVKDVKFGQEDVIQHYFVKNELEELAQENRFEIVTGPEEQVGKKKESDKSHARWWVVYQKI